MPLDIAENEVAVESTRVANFQLGHGNLPDLQLISRLQKPVHLEEKAALDSMVFYSAKAPLQTLPSPGSTPKWPGVSQPVGNHPSITHYSPGPFVSKMASW